MSFGEERTEVDAAAGAALDAVVRTLRETKTIELIALEGHADAEGTRLPTDGLALERARAVHAYLLRAGVPSARMLVRSFGKERPLREGDSAVNRRVEIIVLKRSPPSVAPARLKLPTL